MLNSIQVEKILAEESILVGNKDVLPLKKAVALLGKDAVEYVTEEFDSRLSNTYGIGDYNLSYLTLEGVRKAITYKNIREIQKMEQQCHGKPSKTVDFNKRRKVHERIKKDRERISSRV